MVILDKKEGETVAEVDVPEEAPEEVNAPEPTDEDIPF
jgi:hypothetical protein